MLRSSISKKCSMMPFCHWCYPSQDRASKDQQHVDAVCTGQEAGYHQQRQQCCSAFVFQDPAQAVAKGPLSGNICLQQHAFYHFALPQFVSQHHSAGTHVLVDTQLRYDTDCKKTYQLKFANLSWSFHLLYDRQHCHLHACRRSVVLFAKFHKWEIQILCPRNFTHTRLLACEPACSYKVFNKIAL